MKDWMLAAFTDEAGDSIAEQILAMKQNGIAGMEIRSVDGRNVSDLSLNEAKDLHARLAGEGLCVWSVGSPIGKISLQDDFEKHLDKLKHTLELAQVLETAHMRIFSFYLEGAKPEDCRNQVLDRLERFVQTAEGSGVTLCLENEKGIYGDIPERAAELHRAFASLKAVFDPANFVQCGVDPLKAWPILAPYVEYMHIKDSLQDGSIVPPGEGIGGIAELLPLYYAAGGRVLTMEPHLWEFTSLQSLENGGETSKIGSFAATQRGAFDLAVNKLKELVASMERL